MLGLALAALACAAAVPEGPAALTRAYRADPSPARRTALERYAAAHARDANGALARLALGVAAFEQQDWAGAAAELRTAKARLPKLADYIAYYTAAARLEAKDGPVEPAGLAALRTGPPSPLSARADLVEGRALAAAGKGPEAVRFLGDRFATLPQPEGELALAEAYQASGNLAQAAAGYQRVWSAYPPGAPAARAEAALLALRDVMGPAYPQPSGPLLLLRADKILAAGNYARARAEYAALVPSLIGPEEERARVRLGAADLLAGKPSAAREYLRGLSVADPETRAERLYYLVECARRMDDHDGIVSEVARLSGDHPRSPWRFKALLSAANRFLVANRADLYVPLYRDAYENFPDEPQAPVCRWKVVWHAYINRQEGAGLELRRHLERYPDHSTAAGALYFLGRLAERTGKWGEARAYYARLSQLFGGYYYGLLARERLAGPRLAHAAPDPAAAAVLDAIAFPPRPAAGAARPSPATARRIERARLLRAAGLDDLAADELRFGARTGGQTALLAVELARGGESPFESLRLAKSLRIDYFALPLAEAPPAFWSYLFPLPFRNDLLRQAQAHRLDPFTVAGLIRQESEFNPRAVSRAKAYGLTQVMPATGKQLARKLGMRRFHSGMLFQPAVNLRLGTYFMRSLLDIWDGRWEETLAAYNAGPSRAREWTGWYRYDEPAEFVESIPFTETRNYVQAVLRNAAMYRRLYGGTPADVAVEEAPHKAPVKPPAVRKGRAKRG